jgi:hypothetical protein
MASGKTEQKDKLMPVKSNSSFLPCNKYCLSHYLLVKNNCNGLTDGITTVEVFCGSCRGTSLWSGSPAIIRFATSLESAN